MKIRPLVAVLALGLAAPLTQAQQLIGLYQFDGNFANSLSGGGTLGSLQELNLGGAATGFSAGAWSWSGATESPGTGLRLELGATFSAFSIGVIFQYSQMDDYRKLIDFVDGAGDAGIYINSGRLEPYIDGISAGAVSYAADTTITLVVTRQAGNFATFYIDGSAVTDGHDFNAGMVGDNWRLFMDDGGGEFSSGGSVAEIRVWDYALSAGEVSSAFAAVPEPSSYAALAGLGALGLVAWRRRAVTTTLPRA